MNEEFNEDCNCLFCPYIEHCDTPPCRLYAEKHGMMKQYEEDRARWANAPAKEEE